MVRAAKVAMAVSLTGMLGFHAPAQTPSESGEPAKEEVAEVQVVTPLGSIEQRPKGEAGTTPGAIATATPVPPTLSASWGAKWQTFLGGGGQWAGGAMWDTGAYYADPTLVVATDRLLQAVEGNFGIFSPPSKGTITRAISRCLSPPGSQLVFSRLSLRGRFGTL
jgi:hypothetical protein